MVRGVIDMTEHQITHQITITPLSPIHIGTGEDVDWTRSVLDAKNKQILLFDPLRLSLNEQAEKTLEALGEAALKPNIKSSVFIGEAQSKLKLLLPLLQMGSNGSIAILPNLSEKLNGLTGAQRAINTFSKGGNSTKETVQKLELARAYVNPRTNQPVLLGSGIKGMLRTGWLNYLSQHNKAEAGRTYEKDLLGGSFDNDPFSLIATDDLNCAASIRTAFITARNYSRSKDKPDGVPVFVEAIIPNENCSFLGTLRQLPRHKDRKCDTIQLDDLYKQTKQYYLNLWNAQRVTLKNRVPKWWFGAMENLIQNTLANENALLVRLGKFCTAEYKTTNDRSIRVRISRTETRNQSEGTTFWLAQDDGDDDGLPFGWALLEIGDKTDISASIINELKAQNPWKSVDLSTKPQILAAHQDFPETNTLASKSIRSLKRQHDDGKLQVAFLLSELKTAQLWADNADKIALADYAETTLPQLASDGNKRQQCRELIVKLKS
jgi:CRISPR-associated protein Csm5